MNGATFTHETGTWVARGQRVTGFASACAVWDTEEPNSTREEVIVLAPTAELAARVCSKIHPDLTTGKAMIQHVAIMPAKGLTPAADEDVKRMKDALETLGRYAGTAAKLDPVFVRCIARQGLGR